MTSDRLILHPRLLRQQRLCACAFSAAVTAKHSPAARNRYNPRDVSQAHPASEGVRMDAERSRPANGSVCLDTFATEPPKSTTKTSTGTIGPTLRVVTFAYLHLTLIIPHLEDTMRREASRSASSDKRKQGFPLKTGCKGLGVKPVRKGGSAAAV